jgi:hypothetical protein
MTDTDIAPSEPRGRIMLPAEKSRLKKLWHDSEVTLRFLVETFRMADHHLKALAEREGWAPRDRLIFKWDDQNSAAALKDAKDGLVASDIARKLDPAGKLTGSAVTARLKREFQFEFPRARKFNGSKTGGTLKAAVSGIARGETPMEALPKADPTFKLRSHAAGPASVALEALTIDQCHFAVGPDPLVTNEPQLFCGEAVAVGRKRHRYCEGHARICYSNWGDIR